MVVLIDVWLINQVIWCGCSFTNLTGRWCSCWDCTRNSVAFTHILQLFPASRCIGNMLADGFSCRKHPKTEVTAHHFMDREDEGRVLCCGWVPKSPNFIAHWYHVNLVKHRMVTGPSMLWLITHKLCACHVCQRWNCGMAKKKPHTLWHTKVASTPPPCLPSLQCVKDLMGGSMAGPPLTRQSRIACSVRCAWLNELSILVRLISYFPVRIQNFRDTEDEHHEHEVNCQKAKEKSTHKNRETQGMCLLHYFLHTLIYFN